MGTGEVNTGGNPAMDWHPIQGGVEILLVASCYGNRDKLRPGGPHWPVCRLYLTFFTWDANNAVGLPKQRNSYQSSPTFLCFGSPTALFASQHNLFRTMWLDRAKGLLQSTELNILCPQNDN